MRNPLLWLVEPNHKHLCKLFSQKVALQTKELELVGHTQESFFLQANLIFIIFIMSGLRRE